MDRNYILLFSILACFTYGTVAREAIVNGKEANIKDFPYIVSIMEVDSGHICGGAFIGRQFVLTAAHCFINSITNTFKSKRVVAVMRTNDLLKFDKSVINAEIIKIYVPAEYNATDENTTGDIAVAKLKDSFVVANHVNLKTAKLEGNQKENHVGKQATISGWGWNVVDIHSDHITGHTTNSLLRFAHADVLDNHQCRLEHPKSKIYAEHLCARVEQHESGIRGVCRGDGGGPLVSNGYVIGVLSKPAHDCSERGSSAIYTRVAHYLTFIRNAKQDYVTGVMKTHEIQH